MSSSKLLRKLYSTAIVTTAATGVFCGIGFYKGNRKIYDDILMPAIHLLSPETSHNLAVFACKHNLFPAQHNDKDGGVLKTSFLGHDLKNPLGMAAGFDKHGEAIQGLHKIGFGFIEVGSVTPLPQPGNPKPRVFRLPEDKAVINRYGFNSDGFEKVKTNIQELRSANIPIVIGVNLGKNKTSDSAVEDYTQGVSVFGPLADYLVVNISSPNTPGLRNLQSKSDLTILLSEVVKARNNLQTHPPILLKLAPDLDAKERKEIAGVIQKKGCNVDGLIISNTTIERSPELQSSHRTEVGGLSGLPLMDASTKMIAEMYKLTGGKIPIVGSGGVFSGEDAYRKIAAGASVVQIYTAFVYHGPPIVNTIKDGLAEELKRNGFTCVKDAVGSKVNEILK